jgi:hypothetical protein
VRSPVRILSTPCALAVAALAAACAPAAPIAVSGAAPTENALITVGILVRPEHREYADRFLAGAVEAVRAIDASYGGSIGPAIVLVDPDWRGRAAAPLGALVMEPVHWWSTPTAMAPELAAARAVSRGFWLGTLKTDRLPAWFGEALAELTARRASETLFSRDNLTPGYKFSETRHFGGFVPRFVRIRVKVETDGAVNDAYRAHPHVDMRAAAPTPEQLAAQVGKAILTLVTLERWVGRPVADAIVRRLAAELRGRSMALADFERLASDISGEELTWLFDNAFRSTDAFDYGIGGLQTASDTSGFISSVTARRYGEALFTGSTAAREGRFERGRGISVQTTFTDGQQRIDFWDGRDRTKTFQYRSPSPVARAVVDPDRVLALDVAQTNNSAAAQPRGPAVATEWAVRFALWIESLLLTYAALA